MYKNMLLPVKMCPHGCSDVGTGRYAGGSVGSWLIFVKLFIEFISKTMNLNK